jgi:hypothetical protein
MAAGSAIAGTVSALDMQASEALNPTGSYNPPPPPRSNYPMNPPSLIERPFNPIYGNEQYPSAPKYDGYSNRGNFPPQYPPQPVQPQPSQQQQQQQSFQQQSGGSGDGQSSLFGKLKGLITREEEPSQQTIPATTSGYNLPLPPSGLPAYNNQGYRGQSPPPPGIPPHFTSPPGSSTGSYPGVGNSLKEPLHSTGPSGDVFHPHQQPQPSRIDGGRGDSQQYAQQQQYPQPTSPLHSVGQPEGGQVSPYQSSFPQVPPHQQQQQYHPGQSMRPELPPLPPSQPEIDWQRLIPPEPQLLIHEDCIVLILKPREYYRKKHEMTQAGPNAIQVFADFEHVFTKFRTTEGSRTLGTTELLESSGCVSPEALQQIQKIAEEFDMSADFDRDRDSGESSSSSSSGSGDSYEAFEEMTSKCQQALTNYGQLYFGNVAPATKNFLSQLSIRDYSKEILQLLSIKSVPFFIFSSGYGDVVTQSLIQTLGGSGSSSTGNTQQLDPSLPTTGLLPNNLRIISNFFRAAPDGIVRGFTNPIVHERNKNVTTASRFMNMPVPQRPYALVLAAHEDDVTSLTDGLKNVKDQLSIGFMELSEDLAQRLPVRKKVILIYFIFFKSFYIYI